MGGVYQLTKATPRHSRGGADMRGMTMFGIKVGQGLAMMLFVSLSGCGSGSEEDLINPTPGRGTLHAFIEGRVIDESGNPVPEARIELTVIHPGLPGAEDSIGDCQGQVLSDAEALEVLPDSEGRFEKEVVTSAAGVSSFTGCLVFEVLPSQGGGFAPFTISGVEADFGPIGIPPDTTNVTITVPGD